MSEVKIQADMAPPDKRYQFTLEVEGNQVGEAMVIYMRTKTRLYAYLHDVKVGEIYRRQGYGTQILKTVLGHVQGIANLRQQPIWLQFTSEPEKKAANILYKRLGFNLVALAAPGGTNFYSQVIEPDYEL